ncbi:unnamed protein product [Penicillium salamii]|nr:unnamed protein product [Penicillium salamii]
MGNKLDKMEGGQQSDNDAHLSSDNFSDSYIQFPDFETADQLSSPQPNPESHTQRSSEIDPSAALSDRRQVSRSQAPFPLSLPFGHAERAIPNRSTNRPIDPRLLQDSDHLSTSSTQSSTESFDSAKYIELFAKELSTRLEKVLLFQGRSGERVTDETFEELPTTPSAVQSSHEPSTGDKLGFWYSPYAASYYRELGTDEALASRPATPRAVHYPHEPLTDQNLGLCYSPYAGSSSQQLGTDEASTSRPTTPSTVHSSRELFTDGEDTSHETFLQEAIEALRLAYPESPDLAPSSYWWDEENSTHESHQINSPDLDMRRSSRLQNLAEAAINRGDREGLESNEASTLSATTMADDGMDDDEREDEEPEGSPSNKNSTRGHTRGRSRRGHHAPYQQPPGLGLHHLRRPR